MNASGGTMTTEQHHERLARRADEILHEQQQQIYRRTDRLFAGLMVAAVGRRRRRRPLPVAHHLEWRARPTASACVAGPGVRRVAQCAARSCSPASSPAER